MKIENKEPSLYCPATRGTKSDFSSNSSFKYEITSKISRLQAKTNFQSGGSQGADYTLTETNQASMQQKELGKPIRGMTNCAEDRISETPDEQHIPYTSAQYVF